MVGPLVEHLVICLSAFLFPPIAILTLLVVLLATFGKSLGLRQLYVNTLIHIFEWGARQIKTTERIKRKGSTAVCLGADSEESEDEVVDEVLRALEDDNPTLSRNHGSSAIGIIRRETQIHLDDDETDVIPDEVPVQSRGWAAVHDSIDFVKAGMEAIIEDEVTSRFEAEQLVSWNMLTRTSIRFYQFVNWKLTTLYALGFLFRYCLMLPIRLTLFGIGIMFLVVSTALIGIVPNGSLKRQLNHRCMLICYRILSRCLTAVVSFHDEQNKARNGGICVANHTSPIDAMILSIDNVYALIGQRHAGLLGLIQRALSRASAHIWFERAEAKDRAKVTNAMKDHCGDPNKLPILIFPEGTCINNTSVMMFKKGSFEVGATVYPIAMKYDSRFGDPFWNSSEQSWFEYIVRMMTSWAIICNVWYLPPMMRRDNEEAVDFANRVKKGIAQKGGLVDLEWDGQLKRQRVPKKLVAKQQERYANRLSRYTSTCQSDKKAEEEDDDEFCSFLTPVSGYNSLEELPELVVMTDEDEDVLTAAEEEAGELHKQPNPLNAHNDSGVMIGSGTPSETGLDNSPPGLHFIPSSNREDDLIVEN